MKRFTRCTWCGRVAHPTTGPYLRLVWPERTVCSGCGRFQLHCECKAVAA